MEFRGIKFYVSLLLQKKRDKEIKENSFILEIYEIETSRESMIPFVLKEKNSSGKFLKKRYRLWLNGWMVGK